MLSHYFSLIKAFFAGTMVVFLFSCATNIPLNLSVQNIEGQTTLFNSGKPIIVSSKAVMVAATATERTLTSRSEYLSLRLIFVNTTNKIITVAPSEIKAFGKGGNELEVLSSHQQKLAVEKEYKWQKIGLALQAFGAATSQSTAYQSGTVDGKDYSGTTTYPADTGHKQAAVKGDISKMKGVIRKQKSNYLKRHTVFPGKEYFGSIWIKKPSLFETPYSLELNVPVENENHHFEIIVNRLDIL